LEQLQQASKGSDYFLDSRWFYCSRSRYNRPVL